MEGMDPAELRRVFQMFDRNGDGKITKKELSDSLENLGIFIPDKELSQMIEKIDVNGDGYVDIDEFGALYRSIMNERDEEEDMKEAFNVFDQNGDGFITVEELRSVLASLGLKQGRTIEDCKRMIKKVDVDGDGMVNFKEFKQMMKGGGFAAFSSSRKHINELNIGAEPWARACTKPVHRIKGQTETKRVQKRENREMAGRILRSASVALRKPHGLKNLSSNSFIFISNKSFKVTSLGDVICKAFGWQQAFVPIYDIRRFLLEGHVWIHSAPFLNASEKVVETHNHSGKGASVDNAGSGDGTVKRKKLKGKRAVVRWLKYFRWKKKKEYERMTAEEKILYKLRKSQKKEERLVTALKKIEPAESSETTHDPEILTPEEHFFFLKMGLKCKNYVPVGRRGIYQGVILNMHLHWKKHQTLKVVVKTFSPEEVKEIAAELARLTGGIVLNIHDDNTIIMYRGKNYSQPPTEIMSPRVTLSRKKALDKSKYRDGLRAVRKYIPKLEQDLELLHAQAENRPDPMQHVQNTDNDKMDSRNIPSVQFEGSNKLKEILDESKELSENESTTDSLMASDSEDLSDIFETESDTETERREERPLFLDEFDKFPVESDREPEHSEKRLCQISMGSKVPTASEKDADSPNFDEVDRIFIRAASLLKKKRR
ncbi:uncharacterized CRM domain-containing protein At3g25440, chloroplastic isoform X2 [Herrania umbratica]|uniref:Uncharacterized CRM domain-containing protein At3g25440, chloroplastic isoform X2 n=2 Tax=Herrania umbratica TaxID=108875 RepID=A0A6J0ZJL3_9ROSI|nr:uncharacterized CRM domain-containing protein At3g25440, chloroplastic isoform X2 [Herrania umbratica]